MFQDKIHPFITYLLSYYYVPGTKDAIVNKADKVSILKGIGNKQVNKTHAYYVFRYF